MLDSPFKESTEDKSVVLSIAANQTDFTYYVYCMCPFLYRVFTEIESDWIVALLPLIGLTTL